MWVFRASWWYSVSKRLASRLDIKNWMCTKNHVFCQGVFYILIASNLLEFTILNFWYWDSVFRSIRSNLLLFLPKAFLKLNLYTKKHEWAYHTIFKPNLKSWVVWKGNSLKYSPVATSVPRVGTGPSRDLVVRLKNFFQMAIL